MAKAIHTVLHILMGGCSISPCPEAFGSGSASQIGFNGFASVCLRDDEDDVNIEPELTINENLKEPCARRNAYGLAIEEISRGTS